MSVARYRGSAVICHTSTTPSKRLEGLYAVAEDWHAKVTFMKVKKNYSITFIYNSQIAWCIIASIIIKFSVYSMYSTS